jgi:hypothetical protein
MGIRTGISTVMAIACSVSAGNSELLSCEGISVSVDAPDLALAEQACQAAAHAVPLIAECGVAFSQPQIIEVTDAIPEAPDCMGIYHCGTNRIEILAPGSMESLRRDDSAFYSIPTEIYFDSIIAHELAHAAYDAVPCPYSDCLVTSEYVAYAMQVYSLPPRDQRAFEAGLALENRVSRYEISAINLMMAPDRFARNVWVHFSQRRDGCAYVADMMRANFHLDTARP